MKIEMLVNLKLGNGTVIDMGTIISDVDGPIPENIMKRVRLKQARIIDHRVNPRFTNQNTTISSSSDLETTKEQVTAENLAMNKPSAQPRKLVLRRK